MLKKKEILGRFDSAKARSDRKMFNSLFILSLQILFLIFIELLHVLFKTLFFI